MEFTLPTTRTEMYQTLKEIYRHYRIRFENIAPMIPVDLNVNKMEYTQKTDEELLEIANKNLIAKHQREIMDKKEEILNQISQTEKELFSIPQMVKTQIENAKSEYSASAKALKKQMEAQGIENSDAYNKRLCELEMKKSAKITEINNSANEKEQTLIAKKEQLSEKYGKIEEILSTIHNHEIEQEYLKLTKEQEETIREVFKYNNQIDEKLSRYKKSTEESRFSLEIKYIEARQTGYSQSELVEMGYYNDVFKCVAAYYDSLDPSVAYNEIKNETELVVYLEEYTAEVVNVYRTRLLPTT